MAALKHIKFLISIVVVSAIDNLLKGAAGQALQNFNIMFGFDGMIGLLNIPFYP